MRHNRLAGLPQIGWRKVALAAHHSNKNLLEWVTCNTAILAQHERVATRTTGRLLGKVLDLRVTKLQGGPSGGAQQIGAMIADGGLDFLILLLFLLWDPLEVLPHEDATVR